jgi:hypothetical protein
MLLRGEFLVSHLDAARGGCSEVEAFHGHAPHPFQQGGDGVREQGRPGDGVSIPRAGHEHRLSNQRFRRLSGGQYHRNTPDRKCAPLRLQQST